MGHNLPLKTRRRIGRGINARVREAWSRRTFNGLGSRATLQTAVAGSNNDLVYIARVPGTAGNAYTVRYVVAGNNTPLSVSVVGTDITVNCATNGSAASITTAKQVRDAIGAVAAANALVLVGDKYGDDGSGIVPALAATNLAGA